MYRHFFKRFLDFWIALVTLICISPLLLVIGVCLFVANGKGSPFLEGGVWGRLFFLQDRPGKDGKVFKIIKFKTMTDERDASGELLPDEQRLTKVGKFVRSTSIDELPQLINVLKGDMALIGPRPLLVKYLPLYNKEQMRRHEVRPGITGWAQSNGRNSIRWTEKFKYDVWYVDHVSLWTDIKVVYMTIVMVLKREGINEDGQATMEAFNGNN